ncbi:uncharacterized protein LOC117596408 [Pangasianodon hypophthalmus]|uniref:uncharacterized protein LOC117596408 n=1 Tax=Pangasianodon hypophthalmus TaxID=310915 RepID=UPI0023079C40|nr:uncharacterized protein LOC117596408 [Pangasianodon hypophthalmus]
MEVCTMRYTWAALCITVLVMSGSVTSKEASVTYELTMDITNRIYNDSLLKPGSPDYVILSTQVSGALYSIYGCVTCNTHSFYQKVSAMTFSNQTGTVLVKATLMFQSNQINADVIKDMFMKAIAGDNEINGLTVNPNFTRVIPPSTPAPTVSSTSHPNKTTSTTPTTRPTTRLTIHPTTKHRNAASSFNQSPITLTSFLRYSVSFGLLFIISYSF